MLGLALSFLFLHVSIVLCAKEREDRLTGCNKTSPVIKENVMASQFRPSYKGYGAYFYPQLNNFKFD